ncbi:MAG: ribosome recycling factor [Patescibacteria group bacterium]
MANLKKTQEKLNDIVKRFQDDLSAIRIGKAHIGMVEGILVDSYGSKVPISHVASISTPDAKSILIKPWDKNIMPQIESAIQKSNLGIQPISDKDQIRLSLPPLTEERRKEMTKVVGKKMEETRIAVRQAREELWREIQQEERDKVISENQKFEEKEEMEKMVGKINDQIAELAGKKEKEILTV